jgi:hypothetical protein
MCLPVAARIVILRRHSVLEQSSHDIVMDVLAGAGTALSVHSPAHKVIS